MAKYAIGVRLNNSTDQTIEDAINKAEIIRTHVLRPTWHFVAAEDIRWMLELTAQNLKKALSFNHKRLELDEKTFRKCNAIIEKHLRDAVVFLHMDATVDISKFKIVKCMFPDTAGVYAGPEK